MTIGKKIALLCVVALGPAGAACVNPSQATILELREARALRPGSSCREATGSAPRVSVPRNFSLSWSLPQKPDSISLCFELPDLSAAGLAGRSLAVNPGRLSDVSAVYVNGVRIGGRGHRQPYRPGALAQGAYLVPPEALARQSDGGGSILRVDLFTRGDYYLEAMDPVRFGSAEVVFEDLFRRETVALLFLATYLIAGLFHLVLAWKQPRESHYLYFALYTLVISLYWFFSNTATSRTLLGDAAAAHRKVEHLLLFFILPLFLFFLSRFLHPGLERPARWSLALALGLALAVVLGSLHTMRLCARIWYAAFFLLAPYAFYLSVRQILVRRREATYLIAGMLVLLLSGVHDILASLDIIHTPRVSNYSLLLFVAGLTVLLADSFATARTDAERLLARTTRLNLELLRKNIQPHFLMNSVNACIQLTREDPAAAERMLEAFAEELRETIRFSGQELAVLSDEIALCRRHLAVMSMRREKQFTLEVSGQPQRDATIQVPPLILLTLVENGLTHGFRGRESGRFELTIEERNGRVRLILANDGASPGESEVRPKRPGPGTGTGLRYVQSRFAELFGTDWTIDAGPAAPGFVVRMEFPLVTEEQRVG